MNYFQYITPGSHPTPGKAVFSRSNPRAKPRRRGFDLFARRDFDLLCWP
jgi:hypothetical protein